MTKNKIVNSNEAVDLIHDKETVFISGFGSNGVPDYILLGLAVRFEETGFPRDIDIVFGGGPGDSGDRGVNRLALPGLIRRAIGGHWGLVPKLGEMAVTNKIEAYNFPLGVVSHMLRDLARGLSGTVTKVGLDTFADPALEGCKINEMTTEDLVEKVDIAGEEMLFYRAPTPNVAILRGTTADRQGNVTMERETLTQDVLAAATATRNAGGLVIVQVERIAETGSLDPRRVKIPGILVDCVVVSPTQYHPQTFGTLYAPEFSAELRKPLDASEPMPLNERKVIARRAAFELVPNAVVNLGIGMPEGVAAIASEERMLDFMTLTAEPGLIGGFPQSGLDFGAAVNPAAVLDMNQQFDLYDGGGLDLAFLGLAQADQNGDVNVSRFGPKIAGAGGFINITQNARALVYMGTFTAGGLKVQVADEGIRIASEGRAKKFLKTVEQVTFSGSRASKLGQPVLFVTERCVLELTPDGLELTEYAPGIDIEKDILSQMAFKPVLRDPKLMDPRIFSDEPMGLKDSLFAVPIINRVVYDPDRDSIFVNFEGLRVQSSEMVREIETAVEKLASDLGHKVSAVVNYDSFKIDEGIIDEYSDMVASLEDRFYSNVSRYTTSAFLRAKLGEKLAARGVQPHLYESESQEVG